MIKAGEALSSPCKDGRTDDADVDDADGHERAAKAMEEKVFKLEGESKANPMQSQEEDAPGPGAGRKEQSLEVRRKDTQGPQG